MSSSKLAALLQVAMLGCCVVLAGALWTLNQRLEKAAMPVPAQLAPPAPVPDPQVRESLASIARNLESLNLRLGELEKSQAMHEALQGQVVWAGPAGGGAEASSHALTAAAHASGSAPADWTVVESWRKTMGGLDEESGDACVPALKALARDPSHEAFEKLNRWAFDYGKEKEAAAFIVANFGESPDPELRACVVLHLELLCSGLKDDESSRRDIVASAAKFLNDRNPTVRRAAVRAMKYDLESKRPELEKCLEDKDSLVRDTAEGLLALLKHVQNEP